MKFATVLYAAAIVVMGSHSVAAQPLSKPIRIGVSGPELDACPSVGQVTGTNPRGDHFLNVRRGPNVRAAIRDRLKPDASVIVCDTSADGKWLGVIYAEIDILGRDEVDPPEGGDRDCGISSPVKRPRAYTGPCRSGWVSARFVKLIAG